MTRYIVLPTGQHAYGLPEIDRTWKDPTDDGGAPCTYVPSAMGGKRAAVITDGPATGVTFHRTTPGPVTGYRLDDPALESKRYPLEITVAQRDEMDGDDNRYNYMAVRGPGTPETLHIDLTGHQPWPTDATDATPRPEVPSGRHWVPATAWAAAFGIPTHDHLIPGHLTGFHAAAAEAIAAHPNKSTSWLGSKVRIERDAAKDVEFVFRREDGLTREVKDGRRKTQRPVLESLRVTIHVGPDEVGGATLADALIAWDARMAEVLAQTPSPSVVCASCRGLGFKRTPQDGDPR